MYKDIINYQLAEGIAEKQLLDIARSVAEKWMSNQPGFIKWEIHNIKEDQYTDIVYWKTREDAEKAEADMGNIENAQEWQACYRKGSIEGKRLFQVAAFN